MSEENNMAMAGIGDMTEHLFYFPSLSPSSFQGKARAPWPHVCYMPRAVLQEVWLIAPPGSPINSASE